MSATRVIAVSLLLPMGLGGCSGSPSPAPAPEPVKIDPRPEVFEPVYRVATELRSAQEVGVNRQRFGELLEKLATEVSLAGDKAESPKERSVVQGYAEVLRIYKDAAAIWDAKISTPELKGHAEHWYATVGSVSGSNDLIVRKMNFEIAATEGIPLNFYPEGSTGLDDLVPRYRLPVKDSEGWKTIPNDSVERVWSQARAKTEYVVNMQKG